jgi:hypothetical protein
MAVTGRLFHHSHTIDDATQQRQPILGSGHPSKGKGFALLHPDRSDSLGAQRLHISGPRPYRKKYIRCISLR